MKRRTSCKIYLTARLETCWKYLQTMLSRGKINLSRGCKRSGTYSPLPSLFYLSFLSFSQFSQLNWIIHVSQVSAYSYLNSIFPKRSFTSSRFVTHMYPFSCLFVCFSLKGTFFVGSSVRPLIAQCSDHTVMSSTFCYNWSAGDE